MNVAALDPGLIHPAVAIARDGVVVHASRVKIPGALSKLPMGERCRQVSLLVVAHVVAHAPGGVQRFVTEWPQVYRASRSKGDPNDLLPLAGIGAGVACLLGVAASSPTPAEWIGQLPKGTTGDPWASPRGQFIRRRLTDGEHGAVIPSHDAVDVVGILLHELGRLEHLRTYPGCTE